MISNRLKTIASFVDKEDVTLDVGCDHAYLDIFLATNIKNKKIYASDINNNALSFGIKNIKKNKLENKIEIYLDDGINNIRNDVNTLILSGTGTYTILNILSNVNSMKNIKKLIISSNKNVDILRKELTNKGFYIYDEILIKESNIYYPIIVFKKGNKTYSDNELLYGPILINSNESLVKEYIEYLNRKRIG